MTDIDIAVKIAETEKEVGSLKHRVSELEEQNDVIQQLALSVNELAINMRSMIKEQEKQGQRIASLEAQPANRWNTLTTVIITAIASGLVTYVLTSLL